MITVIAQSYFRPESLAPVLDLYRKLVAQTRKEPGCVRYDAVQNHEEPHQLTMVETWETREDLDNHMKGQAFLNLTAQLKPHASKPTEIKIYKEIL